jgi:hypothetical protein
MKNQGPTRTTGTNNSAIPPQPQNCRVVRSTLLLQLSCLSLLTIGVFVIGVAVRAQDSAKQQAPDSREVSGFLGDYSALVPDAKNGDLLLYEKDMKVLRKYNKFIFDPVTIYLLPKLKAVASTPTIWNDWPSIFRRPSPMNSRNRDATKS